MNKERRNQIDGLRTRAEEIRAMIEALKDDLSTVHDEEQDYKDNMPESLQGGEKGQKADAAIEALESADQSLDTCLDELQEALDSLETAQA